MVRNAVSFYQGDKICGRITSQRGFLKVRIAANEILRLAVKIREIATPATGDKNFLAGALAPLQNCDLAPTFAGFDGAN